MSDRAPQSCNRQPFLSDQECDRGSVDIHQFDDFPLCESIDPTMPAIPPEVVDTPINLPVPPSCACFNIDYALKLKYSKERKFAASAGFSAKGDCCEGNYVTNLNLQIPCPVLGSGTSRRIKMKIGYGNGKGSASVSYLRANQDSCAIEAKNVDIDLNIPCPVKNPVDRKVKIGIAYGREFKGASAKVLDANAEKCELEVLEPTFTLNIPCPVKNPGSRKIKIGISYGKEFKSASASFIKADSQKCTVEALEATFSLNIPCPVLGRENYSPKIRARIDWGSKARSVSASFINTNLKECTIEPKDVDLSLEIPCPVVKRDKPAKVKLGVKWGSKSYVSASLIKTDRSNCTIETNDATFDLEIPCPVKRRDTPPKVKFGVRWGSKSYVSASILKTDPSNCTIETNDATFNLEIPCPVKRRDTPPKVKFGVRWGSKSYVSASILKTDSSNCTIETNDATFNLEVQCPIRHHNFHRVKTVDGKRLCYVVWRRRWTGGGITRQYSSFSTSFLEIDESNCTIRAGRLDLDIPCPISGNDGNKVFRIVRRFAGGTANFDANIFKVNKTNCQIETNDLTTLNLDIPCPMSKTALKIETSASTTSGSVGAFTVKEDTYDAGTCTRTIKLKATFPKGGGTDFSSCSVIREIRYYASKHAIQVKTMNLKTKQVSNWKDITTAVGHMTDHFTCNDK